MVQRCQHDVVTDKAPLANGDTPLILKMASGVDEHTILHSNVFPKEYCHMNIIKQNDTEVIITGGALSTEKVDYWLRYVKQKPGCGNLQKLEILLDGEYVELKWVLAPKPFERIRRITGYLVGDMGRWNNATTAEEKERVKHI